MAECAIARCGSYEGDEVRRVLLECIGKTGFPSVEGRSVLIKPNILSDAPVEKAVTTNPVVVAELIGILRDKGASRILVGDSPGLQGPLFKPVQCGIADVVDKTGAEWVDFTKDNRTHGLYCGMKVSMAGVVDKVDIVISIAKFKTHQLMFSTGCVKNMFGLVPGLNKSPMHLKAPSREEFAKVINGIFAESHTDYALMDAVIGMEGAGPANGHQRKIGYILASADAYAVDYAEAVMMGYQRRQMPIINEAVSRGLTDIGSYSYPILKPQDLVINGFERIEDRKTNLFSALILPYFTRLFGRKKEKLRAAPKFNSSCILCRRCVAICPAKALKVVDKAVRIDERLCIRCYCCHEMCPFGAITVEDNT